MQLCTQPIKQLHNYAFNAQLSGIFSSVYHENIFGLLAINLEIIGLTFLREHGIILGCAASHPTLSFGKLILTMLRLNIHQMSMGLLCNCSFGKHLVKHAALIKTLVSHGSFDSTISCVCCFLFSLYRDLQVHRERLAHLDHLARE